MKALLEYATLAYVPFALCMIVRDIRKGTG